MLQSREHLNAQRLPGAYIVIGHRAAQTRQARKVVSSNVAQWLGERLAVALA